MKNKIKGMTLIETLVYIALLSILMVGVFSSVYVIIYSNEKQSRVNEADTALLLKKYHE